MMGCQLGQLSLDSGMTRSKYEHPLLELSDVSQFGSMFCPRPSYLTSHNPRLYPWHERASSGSNAMTSAALANVKSEKPTEYRNYKPATGAQINMVQKVNRTPTFSAGRSVERPAASICRPLAQIADSGAPPQDAMHTFQSTANATAESFRNDLRSRQAHQEHDCANGEVELKEHSGVANAPSGPSGPCSRSWYPPRLGPRRKPVARDQSRTQRDDEVQQVQQGLAAQKSTAPVAVDSRACRRCHVQKIRCAPNTDDPYGACQNCLRVVTHTAMSLPCLRYWISDASLFREQKAPWHQWTRRWASMDIRDIETWASASTITVRVANGSENASYRLQLREFRPVPGDMIHQSWVDDNGNRKVHALPTYAIVNMRNAADEIRRYVDSNIANYLSDFVGRSDQIFWSTFCWAFQWSQNAFVSQDLIERNLVLNCLRLWVVSRMASTPESICGTDILGPLVVDPSSPYVGKRPLPPVMSAQLEVIMYSTLLRPLRKSILADLETLMRQRESSNWLTIYFALFILLHNCSLTTRRDEQFAERSKLETRFANPNSIREHHMGVLIMLIYYHHDKRGKYLTLFSDGNMSEQEFATAVGLPTHLARLIGRSAQFVKHRKQHIHDITSRQHYGDDYYFVSQLFEKEWQPSPTSI